MIEKVISILLLILLCGTLIYLLISKVIPALMSKN
jgi:hypothetical protein